MFAHASGLDVGGKEEKREVRFVERRFFGSMRLLFTIAIRAKQDAHVMQWGLSRMAESVPCGPHPSGA